MIYLCVGLSNFVLLTFKGGVCFVDLFCYLCFVSVMLSCLFIAALWPPAGEGAGLLALLYVMLPCVIVTFPYVVLGQLFGAVFASKGYPFKNIFDFTTAGDWDCVAAVERLPALHYSVV